MNSPPWTGQRRRDENKGKTRGQSPFGAGPFFHAPVAGEDAVSERRAEMESVCMLVWLARARAASLDAIAVRSPQSATAFVPIESVVRWFLPVSMSRS